MKKGDTFTNGFTISKETHSSFINLFNDKNPLHTQKDFAKKNGFNDIVMHGNILNGFISYFIGEMLPIKNVLIISQDIKYCEPVYLLDKLNFEATVVDIFESVNAVEFDYYFKNQENKKIASGKIQIKIL